MEIGFERIRLSSASIDFRLDTSEESFVWFFFKENETEDLAFRFWIVQTKIRASSPRVTIHIQYFRYRQV